MKLLYIYDKLPTTYQAYMLLLLETIKQKLPVAVLTYNDGAAVDYNIKSYGVKDTLQRLAAKTKISSKKSLDIKIMSKYDIVHLQHSYLYPKLTPFFKKGIKKPKIVITLRGGDTYVKPWTSNKWREFYKTQSKYIDAFVTVSQHQKEYLQKWGVAPEKIHVIPVSFGKKIASLPKKPSKDVIKIVSAHRMCWEKNIAGNLQVIKALKDQQIPVQYDVYGDGSDKGQLLYLIDKYGLGKEVNYIGKTANDVFKNNLKAYDFFLQLSHSEALGASVIEAQAAGIPAIISDAGGLPETIINAQTGYCVDAFNCLGAAAHIKNLFSNPDTYKQFSENAITHAANNFTINKEINMLQLLYSELLSN
jgi:glycosyltransferase involved in cell wall biosynthesis